MRNLNGMRWSQLTPEEQNSIIELYKSKEGENTDNYDKYIICKSIADGKYFLYYYPEID